MTEVVMPQMGESIVEGTLTKWLKKAGEHVERDEPLFEISTDKVDTEIPSPSSGTLQEILVQEGQTVGINTVVGRISDGAGNGAGPGVSAAAAPPAQAAPPQQAAPPPPAQAAPPPSQQAAPPPPAAPAAPAVADEMGPLSPLVRKMARENDIDLNKVRGTGAGGRITKHDLEVYMAGGATAQAPAAAPSYAPQAPSYAPPQAPAYAAPQAQAAPPPPPPPAPAQVPATMQATVNVPQPPREVAPLPQMPGAAPALRVEPMSNMRKKIAEHMIFSKRTSAHVTTVHKVDMTAVVKMRARVKSQFQAQYGFGLTYLPFCCRAAVAALREYPIVNSSIDGDNVIYHRDVNMGIAVALDNGLIVPVIRNADEKNIVGLQRSIVDLAARARSRQLRPEEIQGGTFSITNFGSFGSIFATPLINQPQVAILGLGSVVKEPVVIDDAIAIRSTMYLALTFDHRLIDGALADQFTAKAKAVLENWSEEVM